MNECLMQAGPKEMIGAHIASQADGEWLQIGGRGAILSQEAEDYVDKKVHRSLIFAIWCVLFYPNGEHLQNNL